MSRPASRSSQRPGSRSSFRAPSPTTDSTPEAVALRNQIAATKHEIRQHSARLQQLELALQRTPRLSNSHSSHGIGGISPTSPEFPLLHKRRSFNDITGESLIPHPPTTSPRPIGSLKEGVPFDESPLASRRARSPHDSISSNARTLAEDAVLSPSADLDNPFLHPPPSPSGGRKSLGNSSAGGGTTRVLADLQQAANSARAALDSTKAQLRHSQRAVAQLTRQTEDLKDGRERLRVEIDGLNQVISRKERLLQEVLERARKAEAEATVLKHQLKTESTTSKKSLKDMEAALTAATTTSQKAQSEYAALQSSFNSLGEGWRRDLDAVREEMTQREDVLRKEADEVGKKYTALLQLVQERDAANTELQAVRQDTVAINDEWANGFRQQLESLTNDIHRNSKQTKDDARLTGAIQDELARLLRLMMALRATDGSDGSDDEDVALDLS